MTSGYRYVRCRWWFPLDLNKAVKEFFGFNTKTIIREESKDLPLLVEPRDENEVKADTLQVLLTPYRALLTQKEAKPFTVNDMELREKIMKMYSRDTPTPFLLLSNPEPKFEVENQ